MEKNKALGEVLAHLLNRDLGKAIDALEIFLSVHPHQINFDRLAVIRSDYQLMADYWRRGFQDPQLDNLYNNLLHRLYVLFANIDINYDVRHSPYLSSLLLRAQMSARDWSPLVIREDLESFVSDVAILGLEPPHTSQIKKDELYARHHSSVSELFYYILTSGIWSDSFASNMEEILLLPTIDTNDQQLLVCSVMLSAIHRFDIAKFRMLVHVYMKATDEEVRQRALVGWVFSLDVDMGVNLYNEEICLVEKLLEDEEVCKELMELQKQIIFCIDTQKDTSTIHDEIIPDLMKYKGFNFTRNGIEEVDEDSLDDILHPEEQEQNMEMLEEKIEKLLDMQRQGADVYFGGFSQMKRFPFFNELVNWLVPFYPEHPDLKQVIGDFKKSKFMKNTLDNGPFCNSDKYSFVLAYWQVIGKFPPSLRELLDKGEVAIQGIPIDDFVRPAFIRRRFLQDLYRFYFLFSQRRDFKNILSKQSMDYLFFANPFFSGTHLEPYFNEVMSFLIKKKRLHEAEALLHNYGEHRRDFKYYMMAGYLGKDSTDSYAHALELQPGNERALAGYARALFNEKRYAEALEAYDQLLAIQPDKKSYSLNRSVCLTNLQRYEEAQKELFRLNYESPEDLNVCRALAWTLTCDGKYQQAEKLYNQLLSSERLVADDLLNFGYCLWLSRNIDEAADCFRRYLEKAGCEKGFIVEHEKELILAKGITETECQMMLYIL